MEHVVNYYAGGNTAKGFVHFFESNFQELERLFILKGGPGTGKSTLMKAVGAYWANKGYALEWIHCSSDIGSVDAILIPEIRAGIVDGTAPHIIEPALPGIVDDYVNLGVAWDRNKLVPHKEEIQTVNEKIKTAYQNAYQDLHEAMMNLTQEKGKEPLAKIVKMEEWSEDWLKSWLPEQEFSHVPRKKQRFYGAFTPEGFHHFAHELIGKRKHRFFLQGSYHISRILKKISLAAVEKGYDVEVYHSALDPDEIEMVIIPKLDILLFDVTYFTEVIVRKENDQWIDFGVNHTTFLHQEQNKQKFASAAQYLAETSRLRSKLEGFYKEAMDFSIVNEIEREIQEEFHKLADAKN